MEFRPKKLTALVYCSDELLNDSAQALDGYINDAGSEAISFKLNGAIWEGVGAGKPSGILGSKARVAVAKEGSQAAASIVAANVDKMWMAGTAACRSRMEWHVNQDTEQQLAQLYYSTGASSGQLVYTPPGGLSGSPYGTLKGRPVIPLEFCSTLGTEGDIVLVDWSQYMLVTKGDTVRDVSMHVRFTTDEQTFRFKFRADGQPMWDAPISPLKGNNKTSCIVTLATRS
jgi:HK97 family phage major capsid protein